MDFFVNRVKKKIFCRGEYLVFFLEIKCEWIESDVKIFNWVCFFFLNIESISLWGVLIFNCIFVFN